MDPVLKRQNDSARLIARMLAALVACLLSLQLVSAGAAVAAADSGQGAMFGVICATPQTASDGGASTPVDTRDRRQHGLCCILHCGALVAPTPKPQSFLLPLDFPADAIAFLSATSAPAPRLAPKGAPQSPRPPPVAG